MRRPDFETMTIYCVCIAVCAFALGCCVGWRRTTYSWETDANTRGYAEYYLDENDQRQWQWLIVRPIVPDATDGDDTP